MILYSIPLCQLPSPSNNHYGCGLLHPKKYSAEVENFLELNLPLER